ncbi:MAG: hypothetical protein GYA16_04580 [Spirochaetes bacterium]|nr:hypothetical protein [Spirochaetota bacterium]
MYQLYTGDSIEILKKLDDKSINCCITSPPYFGLRNYFVDGQIGLEKTPEEYVNKLVNVFREVKRVLKDDGVIFLNLGDSYFSSGKREQSYDNCGITKPDCQGRDYLLKSLYDVCKDVDRFRNSDIPHYHAPKQVRELCLKTLGCMEELIDHFPSEDSFFQKQNELFLISILDRLHFQDHAGERLLSFLESTPDVSFQQPQDRYRLLGSLWAFLSRLHSLIDDVQECAHKLVYFQATTDGNQNKTAGAFLQAFHNGYKGMVYAYYSVFESYQHYTTASHLKPKDLIGIPWRVAFALQADGWYLRSDIIWAKTNPMPESVKDRPTKSHEYIFLLSKNKKYYYDYKSIQEVATEYNNKKNIMNKGDITKSSYSVFQKLCSKNLQEKGLPPNTIHKRRIYENDIIYPVRNKRDVWTISTKPFKEAHFATFPPDLILPCVLAGCPEGGIILDPFSGAGTTGLVALQNKRNYIGSDLNPEYTKIAEKRICNI